MSSPQPIDAERVAWIDEYGELSRQIAELKPAVDRHKQLGILIQMWCEAVPAAQPTLFEGQRYTLQISPRENQTKIISIRKVYRALGVTKFLDLCSITLKALRENLPTEKYEKLVDTDRTGPRAIKAVAKAQKAA